MRIIITGAGGFLGKNLIQELIKWKHVQICAVTSQVEILKKQFAQAENMEFWPAETLSLAECGLNKEDLLINCAFPRRSDGEALARGLDYTFNILRMAVQSGIGGVINISSQSVYSQKRDLAAVENETPVELESMYAAGKYAVELLTAAICDDIAYTNIRMASLIGPGFDQRVTNKLVDNALKNRKITIRAGKEKFGFLDVEDAVSGIVSLIRLPFRSWRPIYNLGGTEAYTLLDIANMIVDVFREELGINVTLDVLAGESVSNTDVDSSLLTADTGYQQAVSLKASIRKILNAKLK